jgi:hypothetical protein
MHLDLPGTLSRKGKRLRTQGTAEAVKFRDMVYSMSPDIVYILVLAVHAWLQPKEGKVGNA